MRMEAVLQPRLEQRMKLAPQIIQSIEILQLPTLALIERVSQELEDNPVLEIEEAQLDPDAPKESVDSVEEKAEDSDQYEQMNDVAEDWRDYFTRASGPARRSADDDTPDVIEGAAAKPKTIHDHLFEQLQMTDVEGELRDMVECLIYNVDSAGYLRSSLEEIVESLDDPAPLSLAEDALAVLQSMEPPGVGARDLKECLLLQLDYRMPEASAAVDLITHHLDEIQSNKLPAIAKATGVGIEDVKRCVEFIRMLNPRPGSLYDETPAPYVMPDVRVELIDGRYEVVLEDGGLPPLCVSATYRQMLSSQPSGSDTKGFLQKKMDSARWLIGAIEQRRHTLHRVASKIVEIQRDFFDKGPSHLRPLKMQQVAEDLGIHVSTVSRAISQKYIQSPQGIHDLKSFFSGGTESSDGTVESWETVRQKLLDIIEHENKKKPLSDDDIAKRLQAQGYDIARRTVTKYRKALSIPSSRQRKEY